MSATQSIRELEALLFLEGSTADNLPALDFQPSDAGKNGGADLESETHRNPDEDQKSGPFPPVTTPRARARGARTWTADPEYRRKISAVALQALAEGVHIDRVAANCGVARVTLRGWLISIDEPAYREALAGQIGAKLARLGEHADAAVADVEEAAQLTRDGVVAVVGSGIAARSVMIGPELAKVARARAGVLSDAARLLHWQAEKRLPKLFADEKAGAGPVRASFTFIINGQPAPGGRVIDGDSLNNGQLPGELASGPCEGKPINATDGDPMRDDRRGCPARAVSKI